ADNINMLLLAAMTKPARRLGEVAPWVPAPVAALVDGALSFEPNDRWPDAATMREVVRRLRATPMSEISRGTPPPTTAPTENATATTIIAAPLVQEARLQQNTLGPTSSEPRLSSAKRGILMSVGAVALLIGAAIFFLRRGSAPPAPVAAQTEEAARTEPS